MILPLGRCHGVVLLGRLEKEVLTAGCATCLPGAESKVLPSALILCSCKNMVKSIPRSGFQSPNCYRNREAQGAKVSFALQ